MATTGIFKLTDTYNQQQQAAWPTTARGTEPSCFTFAANAAYIGNTTVYYTTCNPNVTVNVSLILAGGFTNYNFNKPILYYVTANNTTYGNTVIPSTNQQYSFNVGKGNSYIFSTIASYAGTNLTAFSNVTNTIAPVFTLPGTPVITLVTANVTNAANALIYVCHSDRGTNITSNAVIYYAVSNPGNIQVTANTTIINVPGLTACQPYTFTVKASNFLGNSSVSAASNSITPPGDATLGIFFLGYTPSAGATSVVDKYTFSNGTVGAVAYYNYSSGGHGAGNCTAGIYNPGINNSNSVVYQTRFKWIYASCSTSTATSASVASYNSASVGNKTIGIHAHSAYVGTPSPSPTYRSDMMKRDKYTYSNDSQSTGTSAQYEAFPVAAYGNNVLGVFTLGSWNYGSSTKGGRCKYTYSNDAQTSFPATGYANPRTALSTSAFGIGFNGCSQSFNKYTFSSDTVSSPTNAPNTSPLNHGGDSSTGNSTFGIITQTTSTAPQATAAREKFTYSNCTWSSATNSSYSATSAQGGAMSNGIQGVSR